MLLEQDGFLNQIMKAFDRSRTSGSVYITMKRFTGPLSRKSRAALAAAEKESGEVPESKVLVRFVAGKAKFSTLVPAKDHLRFATSLMNISKVKMDALKKLKKREKPPKAKTSKA
ncbi:signal recognition particle, SRP9/SRP14 subunit [Pavlovales sp. CCMP2436]|nr:signal recognition particle, SRP9/SRP14 subunit [Pavlovales sp. CCMP2436]|mmetsp:Transcript_5642/g.14733  ORF Transcript_5642/g.14733 Transcript_5642/m.14733 type:complete len:115 (+) Transcript_5642:81-425(+)